MGTLPSIDGVRPPSRLALQFLTGKEAGRELPFRPGEELILGRGKAAHVVLDDEKASRRHARIVCEECTLTLEDLGSANGTLLNGRKVQRSSLQDGDVIRIGQCGFKIVVELEVSAKAQAWWSKAQAALNEAAASPEKSAAGVPQMSGTLKSVSLVDLLQLLANSQKTGVLTIRGKQGTGCIHFREGAIFHVSLDGRTALRPEKTLYRLLGWKSGTFELGPPVDCAVACEITESPAALLLDGAQEADKLAELGSDLPPISAKFRLARPLPEPLRNLTPEELDLLQLVLEHDTLLDVLDHFAGPDLEVHQRLLDLRKRGVLIID